ncbi:6-phosphofructokinase [Eggerthia catenaformis]|uniref:6-phosphofructokinase n=1 Tax=Eggerthia catenaformis TaxID=31973 RepID=UPI00248E9787|nr:6-phosphofructokinase [Eggerthia catenaformis]
MNEKNCIIGQSGGPTVAINASLAGVISRAQDLGFKHIYGMINGIKGLIENRYTDLNLIFQSPELLNTLKESPAMYLGSCRYKLKDINQDKKQYELLFHKFEELNITDFYYIGGNDSMDTVAKLSEYAKITHSDIHFVGIPKTIDNDLMGTDHTPGFGSAAKYVASSMLEIAYDSSIYNLDSVTIVEIMGRNAGWLTAASALARSSFNEAPDLIYLPEVPFIKENFLNDIREVFKRKRSVIIAVSEGIKNADGDYLDQDSKYVKKDAFGHILHSGTGKVLETIVFKEFQCKVRSIELNVLQRCAMHNASKTDIEESFRIGVNAVNASENHTGIMMCFKRLSNHPYLIETEYKNVVDIANKEQRIPIEWINNKHNDITPELYDYLYPLIQGEVNVTYKDGIPFYINISHLK